MPIKEKIGLCVHSAFTSWAGPFEDKYQMENIIMVGDTNFSKKKWRKKKNHYCIFCNNTPQTTFNNAPHLISRMIGNTDMFSTFECDRCNNRFSKLETDLASFLGVGRSVISVSEEKRTPGYPGINLIAKSIEYKNEKILVFDIENAEPNSKEGLTKLMYQKASYTPANVYKLFLKCALSIIPNDEVVSDFQLALRYLRGEIPLNGAHANIFRFPFCVNMPLHVYLFKRKSITDKLPSFVASFYFHNLIVSIPILLHRDDIKHFNQSIKMPTPPPYFAYGYDLDTILPTCTKHDLSSPKKLKNESEELVIQFDKTELENATRLNLNTGQETQEIYNPSNTKYLIHTRSETTFTKEDMIEIGKLIDKKFAKQE
jgi:hypothetical protein